MVERLARGIFQETVGPAQYHEWDEFKPNAWGRVRSIAQAKAALALLREPTDAMLAAARALTLTAGYESECEFDRHADPETSWASMIDAALKEPVVT